MKIQPTEYQIGWGLAQRAGQRLPLNVTLHLDGDEYRRFVAAVIETAISEGEQRGATASYLAGIRDGAEQAYSQRFEQELVP